MPIINLQRRLTRTGAIRLGNRLVKTDQQGNPVLDRRGNPITYPNKLDTFRITSPHRDVADAVAQQFGGQVLSWQGQRGPEWEVITTRTDLPVLVPNQTIDPNYEFWGNKVRDRFCDGETERIRGIPCLCQRWDNHQHRFNRGACMLCGVSQDWQGEPHTHQFDMGECTICGCTRLCKPTTRINVLLPGIPGIGVFKVESHGINAASELPTLAEMIASAPMPLPAQLIMRLEDRTRMKPDGTIQTRTFYVPELRFMWAVPELMFADRGQLEYAARTSLPPSPVLQAIGAAPAETTTPTDDEPTLTREEILTLASSSRSVAAIRALWKDAHAAGHLDKDMERVLTTRATELTHKEEQSDQAVAVVDAEIIED